MTDIKFETKLDFGSIGGNKRLTYTSWNGGDFKFDIRDWYDNGNCGKGITLSKTELKALYDILNEMSEKLKEEVKAEEPVAEDIKLDIPEPEVTTDTDNELAELEAILNAEPEYPEEVTNAFNKLDKLFEGFETTKAYGVLAFAKQAGKRLRYRVKKSEKDFPEYETLVNELNLKMFISDNGNLYIYTL